MAGLIRRNDIDEVRSRINLADIVGEHVTLRSAGVGSLKGLCPFHDERSPSFHVRPQVGFYHCFGCGEGGDAFTFLMKIEHIGFQDAVERLAARIGYQLHYEDGGQAAQDSAQRTRLLAANSIAADFFASQLGSAEADPARAFLGSRGFDPEAAAHFGVGFAPRSGALMRHLRDRGISEDEAVSAGLLGRAERGQVYDRFRSRLVWPIRDTTGQTVGFGARRLLDADNGPKYLNTPETAIYRKSQVLYGLDLARKDIAKQRQVVVVEGYTDVMACHLAGVTTAVATCGTAFGVDHVRIVRRIMGDSDAAALNAAGEVIFTFDPDEAGQKAASRAFQQEQSFAAQTFVAVAPDGLDPCDLRLRHGDGAVRQLIQARRPLFEFMIRRRFEQFDLASAEGRVAALRAAAPIVAGIKDTALTVEYSRMLAKWLGADPTEVLQKVRATHSKTHSADSSPLNGSAPPAAAGAEGRPAVASIRELGNSPTARLERDALASLLQHPQDVGIELGSRMLASSMEIADFAVVRDAIAVHWQSAGQPGWVELVYTELPEPYRPMLQQLAVMALPGRAVDIPQTARGLAKAIVERDLMRRKLALVGELQRLDESAGEQFAALQRRLLAIEEERRGLRDE